MCSSSLSRNASLWSTLPAFRIWPVCAFFRQPHSRQPDSLIIVTRNLSLWTPGVKNKKSQNQLLLFSWFWDFLCCVSFIFHPPSADGLQFSEKQIQVQRKPPDMQLLRWSFLPPALQLQWLQIQGRKRPWQKYHRCQNILPNSPPE